MPADVLQFNEFYATKQGKLTQHALLATLQKMWQPITQERLVGFGYAIPYLDIFATDTERTCNFMPAQIGAMAWPPTEDCQTCLVEENNLPLPDSAIDRMLVVHALEHCQNKHTMLQEIWRVLTPNGKLILAVPNSRRLWRGNNDNWPFSWGEPYSPTQLMEDLKQNMFTPLNHTTTLHVPPKENRAVIKINKIIEKIGNSFGTSLGIVLIVEAQKTLYQNIKAKQKQTAKLFIPSLQPQNLSPYKNNKEIKHET